MKILIVDDAKAVHAFIKALFKGTSCELAHAMNGVEAIDIISTNPKSFDLVLLDWEMPLKSGLETLVESKNIAPDLPVIMVTSKTNLSDIEAIMKKGASEYVMKPFTKEILFEKIAESIGKEVV